MADLKFARTGALSRRHPVLSRFGPAAIALIIAAHQTGGRVTPASREAPNVPSIRRQAPQPFPKPPFEATLPEKPEIRREEKPQPRRRR